MIDWIDGDKRLLAGEHYGIVARDMIIHQETSTENGGVEMKKGSEHYKTGGVEPFDLYKAGGMMQDFCVANICKYAFRNRRELGTPINPKDIEKIIHYAEELGKLGGSNETGI